MQSLSLGKSDLKTSRLAYGCWRIARNGDQATDLETARAAVTAALDAGYTLFDHADIYCETRAEAVFGQLLKDLKSERERMVIATKCGIRRQGEPTPEAPYRFDFTGSYILQQCEASLQRLGIETIDVYQLHRPDYLMDVSEVAEAFRTLHRQGKVREFGVSNFLPSQVDLLQSALDRTLLVNQVEISLSALGPFSDGTLDQCQQYRMTPLAWSPLGGGLLADGAKDILRHQKLYHVADTIALLDEIAQKHGTTRIAIALAWLLKHPAKIVPIVGSANPERIRDAVKATEIEISREDWYRLFVTARAEPLP